jgi:hypothetical protein
MHARSRRGAAGIALFKLARTGTGTRTRKSTGRSARAGTLARALAVVLGLGLGSAQAQMPAPPGVFVPPQRNFFFILYGGLSTGGDKLAEAQITTLPPYGGVYTSNEAIRAGGLVQFGAGLLWQPADAPLAVQATVGYQADSINADNGDIRFSRVPFEALAFYTGVPRWRFGGGARFVRNIDLDYNLGRSDSFHFKDTNGVVIEAGYQVARASG